MGKEVIGMIGIKGMEMPRDCWDCDLTYDSCNGYTMCSVTGQVLYPMGSRDTRPDECPLAEIDSTEINK